MGTMSQSKIDICKNCKNSLDTHVQDSYNSPYWCYPDNIKLTLIQVGWRFIQMDNLDYIEHLAKQRHLV